MNIQTFENIVRLMHAERNKQDIYIESIPRDIRDAFFDNDMINSLETIIAGLLEQLVDEELQTELDWAIYEWKEGAKFEVDGQEVVVNTLEEYFDLVKDLYNLE